MNVCDIQEKIESLIEEIKSELTEVSSDTIAVLRKRFTNLSVYSGDLFYGQNCLVIVGDRQNGSWRYYAGLEYVDEQDLTVIGELYIYNATEEERIQEILEIITSNQEEE